MKLVLETGTSLKSIGEYVVQINQLMDAIATSAREQSTGLGEINTAVNQMDQAIQQNAAMVEQSTAAVASLSSEAGRLRDLVNQFQLDDEKSTADVQRIMKTAVIGEGDAGGLFIIVLCSTWHGMLRSLSPEWRPAVPSVPAAQRKCSATLRCYGSPPTCRRRQAAGASPARLRKNREK